MSTITEPGRIARTISARDSFGAGRPGTAAVVITQSAAATRSASSSRWRRCCSSESSFAYSPEPPPSRLLLDLDLDELGAEALDLLLDRRAARRRPRPRRRAASRSRSPAGPRRRRRARARATGAAVPAAVISIGKNLPSVVRAGERRAVAGDDRLRGERVHRLRARRARDRLHREARDPRLGEPLDQVRAGERREEADQDRRPARSMSSSGALGRARPSRPRRAWRAVAGAGRRSSRRFSAYAASVRSASAPAPGSTSTSKPASTSFLATSGTSATRRSPGVDLFWYADLQGSAEATLGRAPRRWTLSRAPWTARAPDSQPGSRRT